MVNVVGSRDDYSRWKPEGFEDYFTTAELCRAVRRDRSRIFRYEKEGLIPSPVRVKVGRLKVRLYSPQEVRQIADFFKNLKPGPRKSTFERSRRARS